MNANALSDPVSHYLHAIDTLAPSKQPWLRELRATARARFQELGFPTTRHEDWKYTNVTPITRQSFEPAHAGASITRDALQPALIAGDAPSLVFVDGRFRAELSSPPKWTTPLSLAQALSASDGAQPPIGSVAPLATHAFTALNTAFLLDGAYLRIPAGTTVAQPIHIIYLSTPNALVQPRTLIVAEPGASATVIEHYLGAEPASYFTNAVTEVVLERGASLEHYRVQQESTKAYHVGGLYVRQERDSRFTSHAVDLGGALVRIDLRTVVAEAASCELNGLYVVDGRQHVDNHTVIDHAEPRGVSREVYKGVLAGRARAVFNGRVVVQKDAQHIDAHQINNNLLLSDDVEVDTKPEFEIYADDVKCGHGATVGQLDADALFYLRSRAIEETAARDLLTYAFADDVVRRFKIAPLRAALEKSLRERLLQGRDLKEFLPA